MSYMEVCYVLLCILNRSSYVYSLLNLNVWFSSGNAAVAQFCGVLGWRLCGFVEEVGSCPNGTTLWLLLNLYNEMLE